MDVLIYGLGRSGRAALELVKSQGHTVLAFDQDPSDEDYQVLKISGIELCRTFRDKHFDLCIAAPGVPYDHPDLVAIRHKGTETIGEVEWVFRTVKAHIIGITGTAGKTTVTRWLTDTLFNAGVDAVAGGNIDPALAAVAQDDRVLVTELSSFQLERCPSLAPKVAIGLNLAPDHLDRHGSLAAYYEAKYAITKHQTENDLLILNEDDPEMGSWKNRTKATVQTFSLRNEADAYVKSVNGERSLYLHGQKLLTCGDLALQARHFQANALAVSLAASALGLTHDQVRAGLTAFRGVEGRYSEVGRLGNICFIEDSIATRSLAVKAALEATPEPIVWIAGGVDKGANFKGLEPLLRERVAMMIGVGEAGHDFLKRVDALIPTRLCPEQEGRASLECACKAGVNHLREFHGGKGTILLAPMAASFDQYKDYKERALIFREVARSLMSVPSSASESKDKAWIPS